jgi:predicted house-cleaning noncanonical NTP pyrophosphatase (MazG superfamily)
LTTILSDMSEKLVRDRIPEIIEREGRVPEARMVSDPAEYRRLLRAKLLEEVDEFLADESLSEMADVLEVLRALARAHGWSEADVEAVRADAARERGGFASGYVLRVPSRS